MADVILKNVNKIYEGKNIVVRNVNIEIKDKEFIVLVGPSGCGKSTILRMIAGLEAITSGEIFISCIKVNDLSPKDRNIAMVFQNYALYPHMTVFENMAYGLKIRKYSKDEIKSKVLRAARILGLEEYIEQKPRVLSGGQRQRVAVGRALVRNPKVFLFDEPLSNLDAKLRVQMRTEIIRLHKKLGTTMIYVTHDQVEAMTMGERIVILKDGVVNQIDSPLNLYNNPVNKFVAEFIGSPAMNFVSGKIEIDEEYYLLLTSDGVKLKLNEEQVRRLSNYRGKELIVGIRPENFKPVNETSTIDTLEGTIEVVEPIGNEVYLHFILDSRQMIAKIVADKNYRPGDKILLHINTDKLHFFDKETEKAI